MQTKVSLTRRNKKSYDYGYKTILGTRVIQTWMDKTETIFSESSIAALLKSNHKGT